MQVQQDDIAKNPVPAAYTERAELQLPRRKANFWFTIITLIYLFDWIHRYILAAVLPSIKKEFGITDAAAGFLGGYIVHLWGWRSLFGIMAIPGFLLAVSILFAPDYKTKKLESGAAREVRKPVAQIFKTLSKHQLPATVMAMCQGANIRTGLKGNIYYSKGVLAKSNAQLVERMVRLAREIGREIATVDEARAMMGIAS